MIPNNDIPNVAMNIPMAPNAFDLAVLISSNPVIKNGCVCNNTPTNSCRVEMEKGGYAVDENKM